jgi:hypothetical protein
MPHPRQLIRDAVVTALTGSTAAGSRVYATKWIATRRSEMPEITVSITDEPVDDIGDSAPREYFRRPSIIVEAFVGAVGVADIDNTVDDLASEIEAAMDVDRYFGGVLSDSRLSGTEIDVDTEGDRLTARLTLTYVGLYFTYPDAPTLDDEFTTVEASFDLGADAPTVDQFDVK